MADSMLIVAVDGQSLISQCGGTMARYASEGWSVHVVLLCEVPDGPWGKACLQLGVSEVKCLEYGAAPLKMTLDRLESLARTLRIIRPKFILTHAKEPDFACPDHYEAAMAVLSAYNIASGAGAPCEGLPVSPRQTPMFAMEPQDLTFCPFRPGLYLDISQKQEEKYSALSLAAGVEAANRARFRDLQRGEQVREHGGNPACQCAEAFSSYGPVAGYGYFVW